MPLERGMGCNQFTRLKPLYLSVTSSFFIFAGLIRSPYSRNVDTSPTGSVRGDVSYLSLTFRFAVDCRILANLLPYLLPNVLAIGSHSNKTASTALDAGNSRLLRTGPFGSQFGIPNLPSMHATYDLNNGAVQSPKSTPPQADVGALGLALRVPYPVVDKITKASVTKAILLVAIVILHYCGGLPIMPLCGGMGCALNRGL
jgi:hypothetical protein